MNTAATGEAIPVIDHDPNDCCFNRECPTCEGLIWGVVGFDVPIGRKVKVTIWGEDQGLYGEVVTMQRPHGQEHSWLVGVALPEKETAS